MEDVMERVVEAARSRLGDQLTLDELAKIAMFSKFHFARMFRRTTGVSPGRFLSAMRLHEAKRLLITTSLSVADISYQVGYNSVGTFTSRFTASVGVPPTVFRKLRGYTPMIVPTGTSQASCATVITTHVRPAGIGAGPTFVGVFPTPVPEGRPVRCRVLPAPGLCSFQQVPPGRWYVLAVSASLATADLTTPPLAGEHPAMVGMCGPVDVQLTTAVVHAEVSLKPMRRTDPPVLLALMDLPVLHRAGATVPAPAAASLSAAFTAMLA